MTNNEHLNGITRENDTPEISSVKMILAQIDNDIENGLYGVNRDTYLGRYKAQKEWLESEVEIPRKKEVRVTVRRCICNCDDMLCEYAGSLNCIECILDKDFVE